MFVFSPLEHDTGNPRETVFVGTLALAKRVGVNRTLSTLPLAARVACSDDAATLSTSQKIDSCSAI
jgi:hypothetical protein